MPTQVHSPAPVSPPRLSLGANPIPLDVSTCSSLASSPRGVQRVSSAASSNLRPACSPATMVVVSNIQLNFDPNTAPALREPFPLFVTVGLSPNASSSPAPTQRTTAEVRPVAVDPCAAVVSWYQCWTFGVAEDTAGTAAVIVTINRRTPAKRTLHGHRVECLGKMTIPLKALPLHNVHTERGPVLPLGGTLSVILQLCMGSPTAPPLLSLPLPPAPAAQGIGLRSRLRLLACTAL
eukprot:RCo007963